MKRKLSLVLGLLIIFTVFSNCKKSEPASTATPLRLKTMTTVTTVGSNSPSTTTTNYTYATDGKLNSATAVSNGTSTTTNYTYTTDGKISIVEGSPKFEYQYNASSKITQYSYYLNPSTLFVTYDFTYGTDGKMTGFSATASNTIVNYNANYDSSGKLINIQYSSTNTYEFNYDSSGRIIYYKFSSNSPINYEYNTSGKLTKKTVQLTSSTETTDYTYDSSGKISSVSETKKYTVDVDPYYTSISTYSYGSNGKMSRKSVTITDVPSSTTTSSTVDYEFESGTGIYPKTSVWYLSGCPEVDQPNPEFQQIWE